MIAARTVTIGLSALVAGSACAEVTPFGGVAVPRSTTGILIEWPNTVPPGATHTEFSLFCAISPTYPIPESHILVIDFTWRSPDGTLMVSPDNAVSVPAGETRLFSTHVFDLPETPTTVGLLFYSGGLMIVSGEFTHESLTPAPGAGLTLAVLPLLLRRRRAT